MHGIRVATLFVLMILAAPVAPAPAAGADVDAFAMARKNSAVVREALARSRRVLGAYLDRRDPVTGLLPRNGRSQAWYVRDSAADLYPFLVMAAYYTDRAAFDGPMHDILRDEIRLSTRVGMLSDNVLPGGKGFEHPHADLDRIIFGSCEYAKDGLLPLTELLGHHAWHDRLVSIADDIIAHASVETDAGRLPSLSAEVNGEFLQVLSRLAHLTGNKKYIAQMMAIGEFYFREVIPRSGGLPAHQWNLAARKPASARFSFVDHGNEIVGGLSEWMLFLKTTRHPRYDEFEKPFVQLIHTLLDCGLNADGVWVSSVSLPDRKVADRRPAHCWGYLFNGVYTAHLVTGEPRFLDATRRALVAVTEKPTYLDDPGGSGRGYGSNAYSDAIESAVVFLNRFPDARLSDVLDTCVTRFLRRQRPDGIIEDWYGDGNYVRTALMVAFMKSQGTWIEPWREDIRLGAVRDGNRVSIALRAERPWRGRLRFDVPRHRRHFRLPVNYPRLNEFPEWFVVEPLQLYRVRNAEATTKERPTELHLGAELSRGFPIVLEANTPLSLAVTPVAAQPRGDAGRRSGKELTTKDTKSAKED